jgi:hypothetical protein
MLALLLVVGLTSQAQATDLQQEYVNAVAWWGSAPTWCATVEVTTQPGNSDREAGHADIPLHPNDDCGIVVDDNLSACELTVIMRHETGHLLGYSHSSDPNSVMYGEPHRSPLCETADVEARIEEYVVAIKRQVKRCRQRRTRRASCFVYIKELRREVRGQREVLITIPQLTY